MVNHNQEQIKHPILILTILMTAYTTYFDNPRRRTGTNPVQNFYLGLRKWGRWKVSFLFFHHQPCGHIRDWWTTINVEICHPSKLPHQMELGSWMGTEVNENKVTIISFVDIRQKWVGNVCFIHLREISNCQTQNRHSGERRGDDVWWVHRRQGGCQWGGDCPCWCEGRCHRAIFSWFCLQVTTLWI